MPLVLMHLGDRGHSSIRAPKNPYCKQEPYSKAEAAVDNFAALEAFGVKSPIKQPLSPATGCAGELYRNCPLPMHRIVARRIAMGSHSCGRLRSTLESGAAHSPRV
jgi:hypothetical protein